MAVTKEITRLEKSNVKMTLTVPQEEIRTQYQNLIRDYTKNMQLPGFRKGKVPQQVLERKFGDTLKNEAVGRIIEAAVLEVFENKDMPRNEKPLPYSQPVLDGELPKLDFDAALTFAVTYDVLPDVTVGAWKGLEAEAVDAEVSDEDINRELDELRERNAIVMDKDEGAAAENGDVVTVNYCELDENGEALPHSEREDFVFTLGSGYNSYQFDDEITGIKKGETKEFSKTFPEDFSDKNLAGRTKKLRVTLVALKQKQLPALDDDLAQDVDEKYKTLDDLKNSIRERLAKKLEGRLRSLKINAILEKIMENTPVVLPESMVRTELEGRLRSLGRQFNMPMEQVIQMLGSGGPENIEKEWRPSAENALHSRLIVETLIEDQKLEAGDDEVEKEFEAIAAENDTDLAEVKKYYEQNNMMDYLREDLKERKLFDLLLSENTIKPGKKEKYLDIMGNNR